ncbi:plasmid partitioning/stability family protein [Cronobacter dublinensis]|uniref:plasmid partitioning/stability family protein n=1 Tax=Cronobacter dublinensis TaxID=413497 RepID=UPI000CFDA4EB|nr:plasmid partitioning/stability family protein [Cronobacter dublinensis]
MPAGKYTFYLHSDDRTDMMTAATIETVSQPLRGDFLRTVAAAGGALYQIDARLPGLLTELFDGKLRAGQLTGILAVVSGRYTSQASVPDEALESVTPVSRGDEKMDRRRFTLILPDEGATGQTLSQLESVSARLRGQLLRNLIVAGCALHTLDPRFPRLLTTLPVPPANTKELAILAGQLIGVAGSQCHDVSSQTQPETDKPSVAEPYTTTSKIVRNMRNLF